MPFNGAGGAHSCAHQATVMLHQCSMIFLMWSLQLRRFPSYSLSSNNQLFNRSAHPPSCPFNKRCEGAWTIASFPCNKSPVVFYILKLIWGWSKPVPLLDSRLEGLMHCKDEERSRGLTNFDRSHGRSKIVSVLWLQRRIFICVLNHTTRLLCLLDMANAPWDHCYDAIQFLASWMKWSKTLSRF